MMNLRKDILIQLYIKTKKESMLKSMVENIILMILNIKGIKEASGANNGLVALKVQL